MRNETTLPLLITAIGFGIFFIFGNLFKEKSKPSAKLAYEQRSNSSDQISSNLPAIDFQMLGELRQLDLIDEDTLEYPESLKKLDGKEVTLIGFMAPFDNLRNMRRCMILPSYVGCTFCNSPDLSQVVYVSQGGKKKFQRDYPFIQEASFITGTFRIALPENEHEGKQQGFLYSLENAVVTPYKGPAPKRAPGHKTQADHTKNRMDQSPANLPPIVFEDLVKEVAELLEKEPIHPIRFETVSSKVFKSRLQAELETTFPVNTRAARASAFSLLGFLPKNSDWIDTLTTIELTRHLAITNKTGTSISLPDSFPLNHPYVRLTMVGEITKALTRQHHPEWTNSQKQTSEDSRRTYQSLQQGLSAITAYRYAQPRGISTATQLPAEFNRTLKPLPLEVTEFSNWLSLPRNVGPFFVDFFVGPNKPLPTINPVLSAPPTTTMALFRPRWYQEPSLWSPNPVPSDFANHFLETPPLLTDVLGPGGLIPWLAKSYSIRVAKFFVSGWTGDRWAVWQLPNGDSILLLETRWQDEESARQFLEAIHDSPEQKITLQTTNGIPTVRLLRANSQAALERLPAHLLSP